MIETTTANGITTVEAPGGFMDFDAYNSALTIGVDVDPEQRMNLVRAFTTAMALDLPPVERALFAVRVLEGKS